MFRLSYPERTILVDALRPHKEFLLRIAEGRSVDHDADDAAIAQAKYAEVTELLERLLR